VKSSAAKRTATASSDRTLYAAASLSLVAALIHLWVAPEHFGEWWGYGAFFLVAAVAQLLYALILLRRPVRTVLLAGIAGNLAIVVLYLLTRTVGIPLLGPEAGEVEGVGLADVGATTSEVGIALALGAALLRETTPEKRRTILLVVAVGLVLVGHVVHLVLGASRA
jgi:MFS family permease